MPQTLTIRDFTDDDYSEVTEIYNIIADDQPATVDELVEWDRTRPSKCKHRKWVAVVDDRIAGFGQFAQYISKYDPGTFYLWGGVRKADRSGGVGKALYNAVVKGLSAYNPKTLRAYGRADNPQTIDFLQRRGFSEYMRQGGSYLDPKTFDPTPYQGLEKSLRGEAIEIKTLRELEIDPDRDRKLYDLDWEVTRGEPNSGDDTRVDFETFLKQGLHAPWRLPDGYFVAVHENEYVGVCLLDHLEADNSVKHGITGVTRPFRRKGIALAMKVRAIEYAKKAGHTPIRTDNDTRNQPMLAINNRLGFVPEPEWIFFEKKIQQQQRDSE